MKEVDTRPTSEGEALVSPANRLAYLGLAPPEVGEITSVAPGVHWLRMPLPMELDHINLWLLEDHDGFVLIDTGLDCEPARKAWERLEREVLARRPLKRIVLTHLHPDHAGLAAWLQARHGVPVWASHPTDQQIGALLTPLAAHEIAERTSFFVSHGVHNPSEIGNVLRGDRYRTVVSGRPSIAHWPDDREQVHWGGRAWQFIETAGHATGHLCLHCPERHLLVSGDQILPTISPNVSLTAWSPDPNPLASFLASLERLMQLDPETLVLPSHGRPFRGLQARAADLRAHHEQHLARLIEACATPLTAYETLRVMFRRSLRGFHQFLALGEAIAHLEYLAAAGPLSRAIDAQGVIRFQRT